ncbi:hypothetical protein Tsubulata_045282 [Turnera subulata]|uniref:Tryptophan synthase beta chain-like PALP domain-containing protein n=1 Tax=Turnera subulata TaxID=218843 RepID=A0A9Q0G821_9ROSI|nr:hypothetical protein Tsubulata_045282 [Turnera subulata]
MVSLGHLPTPIHKWNLPNLPTETEVWLKRDDLTGVQLTGNKVRKLEFLMADAMARGADSIVTSGYIQSNHCRAAAAATTYLNLESHLILRTDKVHAYAVCDHPEYFYDVVQRLTDDLGAGLNSRDIIEIHNVSAL